MNLHESSLTRIWQHFKSDKVIVIFTAFRDEYTYEDNIRMNKKFAAILKNNKFEYFYVNGYFPENEDTDEEVNVKENSIFAISSTNQGKNLIDLCHKLANSDNQDSIIVKESSGDIYFLKQNGEKEKIGNKLTLNKISQAYSQYIKKMNIPFIFEGVEQPGSNSGRMVMKSCGIKWVI